MAYTTTPGIPSAFQVATNENYVSTLSIHQPEVAEDFVNRYGEQSLMGFLDATGAMAPVSQRKYEHYEDDYLHQNFKQTGTPTITVGGVTITLDPAFSSDGTTSGNFFIRVGDIVQNSYGEIALVTAKPANNTATLVPYKNASWTALAATDVLIVIGNEHAEGTGQPDGITPTANHYENYTMIMKDSFQVTGSEATNKIWFKVNDAATGKSGYLWYLKGEGDTYKRFNNYCEMQMLLGQVATNTNAALTGTIGSGGINGTEGLIDFMRSGNSQTYNQLAGFNLSDFDSMIRTLDANRGAKENTPMLGAAGYNYSGMGLVIPGDMGKDAKSRESIPSLRVRYKEAGGYSRKMEHWLTGSAGLANPTSDVDELRCHYRTERGFEGFANNRFILLERA